MKTPPSATPAQVLAAQNFRYATKVFDAKRKLTPEQWNALAESLRLSPSSFGLQPWRFINVVSPQLRAKLREVSWGQGQVTDASHYVVLAARTDFAKADIERFIPVAAKARGVAPEALEAYKKMMSESLLTRGKEALAQWCSRQLYIAFGNLMTAAATMGIDTCPIEGLDPVAYDKILGLENSGYATYAGCAIGFRSGDDKYASYPKARYELGEVVINL